LITIIAGVDEKAVDGHETECYEYIERQGLVRRPKRRRKLAKELRKPLYQPPAVNEVWSIDFVSDSLTDGRAFRVLNVIDDYNRECLLSEGSLSFPSEQVMRQLEELLEYYGKPKYIRTDNGPEFTSKAYKEWCENKGIIRVYSEPGKPMENGYIERFNRTFREDVLDSDIWRTDYNDNHPHTALG